MLCLIIQIQNSKRKIRLKILLLLLSLSMYLYSTPSITGTSGSITDNSLVTITGSGFTSKTSSPPTVWDPCTGTVITNKWSGAWPSEGTPDYLAQYRATPYRSVNAPHEHISKVIAGSHGDGSGAYSGYDVMVWKNFSVAVMPVRAYMSWYERADPNWIFGDDNNYKVWDFSAGSSPYTTDAPDYNNFYIAPFILTASGNGQYTMNDDGATIQNPDQNGHSSVYWGDMDVSPMDDWHKIEVEISVTDQNDGYLKLWENGVLKIDYLGTTDLNSGTDRCIGIGGYARNQYPDNYRYFGDLYFDLSFCRIVIGNNTTLETSSVREIQVPVVWTGTSVSITVNQGAFSDGATAYLYAVDSTGNPSTGYPITFGATTGAALTWVGSTSDASLASNYSPAQAPTSDDTVILNTGSAAWNITSGHPLSVAELRVLSGYTGTVTIDDTLRSNYVGFLAGTESINNVLIVRDSIVYGPSSSPTGYTGSKVVSVSGSTLRIRLNGHQNTPRVVMTPGAGSKIKW